MSKLDHPLEKGTVVRVKHRQGLFTVARSIETDGKLSGYWLLDPKLKQRAIRLEEVKAK
jgi:hypothetical protein